MRKGLSRTKSQFAALYNVFFQRVIDLELMSANADPTQLAQQFATILITVSVFFSLPVFLSGGHRLTLAGTWTAEHFFIETTVTVAGLIAIVNWDAAFPDRRDVLVLAPWPGRASTLLTAKISALFAAPTMAMLAFNFPIGLAWPLIFRSGVGGLFGALRAWPAYWFTILIAGAFLVFTVLAIQGLAANLLPRQLFLQLSALLQAGTLCLLLSVYFLEPSLEAPGALAAPENQRLLTWLPSYWFLGLFNQLNGSMDPALIPLVRRAWIGSATSALGACAALLLSYYRMLPKIIEQSEIMPTGRKWMRLLRVGSSLDRALTTFSFRTIMRSRQHRMILSFYLGIGLAMVLGYVKTPFAGLDVVEDGISTGFLLASTLTMILTILALRVIASIPITLPANWIMRVTQVQPTGRYRGAVRMSWILLGVAPVLLPIAGWGFAVYPGRQMIGHLVTMLFLGIILVELCLSTFQKIPFTCSYLPGKANIHFVFWACVLLFIRLLKEAANFESRMLRHSQTCFFMIVILALTAFVLWCFGKARTRDTDELTFEDEYTEEMVSLKLN